MRAMLPSRDSCYICEDDDARLGPVYRVCLCNHGIHEGCFDTLVTTVSSHTTMCGICRYAYVTHYTVDCPGAFRFGICIMFAVFWGTLLYDVGINGTNTRFLMLFVFMWAWSIAAAVYEGGDMLSSRVCRARDQQWFLQRRHKLPMRDSTSPA